MQGIMMVTWERYLADRFGNAFLSLYRETLGETTASVPLASRVYDDAQLLAGVSLASQLAHFPVDSLLREYGRYFLLNGLTDHLCAYLLAQVHSGRDLLLMMRKAHAQMKHLPDGLTPPVFGFELSHSSSGLILIYDSHRQLCPVLYGSIEGAAERFGEVAHIFESACMRRGAECCRFEVNFMRNSAPLPEAQTPQQIAQARAKQQLADLVLTALPDTDGLTLQELRQLMQHWPITANRLRPSALLEALKHLQFAGLVGSTANQPGDTFASRRYWRVPVSAAV
jgi:hypothetical protein